MKIIKNNGPNKEPYGTPYIMADQVEIWPSMTTLCCFSVRWSIQQFSKLPEMLKLQSFCRSIKCDTLSNALEKSKNTISACSPSSKVFVRSWRVSTNWVAHERPLKLCWRWDQCVAALANWTTVFANFLSHPVFIISTWIRLDTDGFHCGLFHGQTEFMLSVQIISLMEFLRGNNFWPPFFFLASSLGEMSFGSDSNALAFMVMN